MASLTGLAFQIDFLVGRGSRRNAVSTIRDTVDQINLVAKQGATKASAERRAELDKNLKDLETISTDSTNRLIAGREAAAKSVAGKVAKAATAATRKAKVDTSGLDALGKKTKSVAGDMKATFKSLNSALKDRGIAKLAGAGFGSVETMTDYASRERAEREQILAIVDQEYNLKRQMGTLMEGDKIARQALLDLEKEALALEKDNKLTQDEVGRLAQKYHKEFQNAEREQINMLREEIQLRREAGEQVSRMTEQVGTTLRNAFVYSTAAVAAFYYKLNDVLQTFRDFENELINAQSIFQTTQDTLFGLSDQIAEFGLNYGVELQNATTGLYQLASAGLSASDSVEVLNNTLKLSMAVQGDHNTISKLTTQTIFGFGLEMSDSAALVDKFAFAINKSLIEYQDLASAVKFAMPFFVSTGQSVDQLLGSLQVLTNRALEAGIAGRGLRQALAEFAESADDNSRAFRKMGIEVTNSDGTFRQLTEIARDFHDTFGETSTDVELMTTLLEDLNVRGATAFVHLVQNVDEFEQAVGDLQNSAGSATQMAEIQQQSLHNQIQILKNALMAPFIITDEIGKASGFMNEFHMVLHNMVQSFSDLIYTTLPDGQKQLTELGKGIKTFVIEAFKQLTVLLHQAVNIFKNFAGEADTAIAVFNMILIPLKAVASIIGIIGIEGMQMVLMFRTMNKIIPMSTVMLFQNTIAELQLAQATTMGASAIAMKTAAYKQLMIAQAMSFTGLLAISYATLQAAKGANDAAMAWGALGGGIMAAAIAMQAFKAGMLGPAAFASAVLIGAAAGAAYVKLVGEMMKTPELPEMKQYDLTGEGYETPIMDTGGRIPMYDTGGRPDHRVVMVEPGESIISKTQNMAEGMGDGPQIVIQGDVYDAEKFAEKVAEVLPHTQRITMNRGMI